MVINTRVTFSTNAGNKRQTSVKMSGVTPLQQLAARLGLSEPSLIRKADEYERLLKLKLHGANRISDSTQAVICLDFAASLYSESFDTESALKLAAVRKPVYVNYKNTIGKLLGIDDVINVNSLCVQLGCTNLCDLANDIFTHYKKNSVENCDWEHPQFACMAVYQASGVEKIKISKGKFINFSRLKSSQWNELEVKWTKIISQIPKFRPKTKIRTKKDFKPINIDNKENHDANHKFETDPSPDEESESYETWRDRILDESLAELKLEKDIINDVANFDKQQIAEFIEKYTAAK